jgi:dihydrofolate reductase
MNARPKLVFSRSPQKAEWNSRIENDIPGTITALKQQPGKDLVLFAGAELVAAFREAGLVDEYRVMVYPVVLGGGTPFFQRIQSPAPLELLGTRTFKKGNVLLRYRQAP